MAKILIIFSTTDGHTRKICLRLKQVIEEQAHQVTLQSIDDESSFDLSAFDKIVLGASIRYGKHSKQIYDFVKRNNKTLVNKPNAFFSVSLVARKLDKNKPETNPYLRKFLTQIPWHPKNLAVFAGKIDYQKYRFWDRKIIQFIMWLTKGPTDSKIDVEYTNWKQVESFGFLISEM
jgi:menaquinone-dependent protoporphyrinogen oxidase